MEKVFTALADKNRRKIIELLHKEDSTLLKLSENFPFSFQALSKQIKILEEASIIRKERKGKFRVLSLNRHALKESFEWVSFYSNFWETSFDRLERQLNEHESKDGKNN